MEIKIRKAVLEDLGEIQRLNKALFIYETRFNDEYNLNWTYSDVGRNYFAHRLESEDSVVFIAQEGSKVIGYILAFINTYPFRKPNPVAEVENMFVQEEFRGSGVGKRLMSAVREELVRRKVKRLKVEAVAQNYDAIQFYKRCGFEDFDIVLEIKLD